MDKGKRKKRSQPRKKRLQLDEGVDSLSSSTKEVPSTTNVSNTDLSSPTVNPEPPKNLTNQASTSKVPESEKDGPSNAEGSRSPLGSGASSPEPNCAICLSKLENKSFTDSCFHMFCFVCLVEWSKVKAECPLCKQSFKSIVHNVRSYDDYDQYHIPRPEERTHESNNLNDFFVMPGVRFRYRTTVTDHRYAHIADRLNQEIQSRLLQRPSAHLPIPNRQRLHQPANSDFRRSVYLQRLRIRAEARNTRRRIRETSPSFFRDNPAQTHRLVPWLNRELNALLQGHGEQMAFVLDLILGLIKRHPIDSEEFYQHVFPFTGRNTRQFMKEFMAFAKSPYHMAAYDRHVTYEENDEPNVDSDSDSDHQRAGTDDGNDSDVMVISPPGPCSQARASNIPFATGSTLLPMCGRTIFPVSLPIVRSAGQEDLSMAAFGHRHDLFAPPSASTWDSPTPGPSSACIFNPILPMPGNRSIWCPSSRSYSDPATSQSMLDQLMPPIMSSPPRNLLSTQSTSQGDPSECPDNIDSDNSDVEIVEVEKPWTERSPIQLSSAAESDYDVMITGTGHVNDEIKTEVQKKKHKKHKHSREKDGEKRKRSTDSSAGRSSKKRRHQSQGRSASGSKSRSRSRSLSPVRLTLYRSPDYHHKKFSYKTHDYDNSDERMSLNPYSSYRSNRGMVTHRSRSRSSSTGSDHHVSIMSHKHKLKSRHSSIEIVEYRKKSSKHKKGKKNKKDRDSLSHSKHKHKSKKKKHKKDRLKQKTKDSESINTDNDSQHSRGSRKRTSSRANIYTSDSETDSYYSDIDVESVLERKDKANKTDHDHKNKRTEQIVQTDKPSLEKSNLTAKPLGMTGPSVDVEEITAAQAAVIDQELDSINRALASNDYISSLFTNDSVKQPSVLPWANSSPIDPDRMVDPNNVLNLRGFKKHPFGHKKSGKKSTSTSESTSLTNIAKTEDTIQSSDITSCSELESDRQLPSFLTFVGRNQRNNDIVNRYPSHSIPESIFSAGRSGNNNLSAYDSPTSSEVNDARKHNKPQDRDSDVVDVETMSDNSSSDVDVTGDVISGSSNLRTPELSNQAKTRQPNEESDNIVDIEGDSDSSFEHSELSPKQQSSSYDSFRTKPKKSSDNICTGITFSRIPSYSTGGTSLKLPQNESSKASSLEDESDVECIDVGNENEANSVGLLDPICTAENKVGPRPFYKTIYSYKTIPSYKTSENSIKFPTNESDQSVSVDEESDVECVDVLSVKEQEAELIQRENESEIDVDENESDIECSLVEGHKTFEIADDSASETEEPGKAVEVNTCNNNSVHDDVDVVQYCDDDETLPYKNDNSNIVVNNPNISTSTENSSDSDDANFTEHSKVDANFIEHSKVDAKFIEHSNVDENRQSNGTAENIPYRKMDANDSFEQSDQSTTAESDTSIGTETRETFQKEENSELSEDSSENFGSPNMSRETGEDHKSDDASEAENQEDNVTNGINENDSVTDSNLEGSLKDTKPYDSSVTNSNNEDSLNDTEPNDSLTNSDNEDSLNDSETNDSLTRGNDESSVNDTDANDSIQENGVINGINNNVTDSIPEDSVSNTDQEDSVNYTDQNDSATDSKRSSVSEESAILDVREPLQPSTSSHSPSVQTSSSNIIWTANPVFEPRSATMDPSPRNSDADTYPYFASPEWYGSPPTSPVYSPIMGSEAYSNIYPHTPSPTPFQPES